MAAVPAEQNFGDFTEGLAASTAVDVELHVVEAGDLTAIDADEMGMALVVVVRRVDGLETPYVVTQFRAPQQTTLGEIVQIAERRRLVKTVHRQPIGELRVGHR